MDKVLINGEEEEEENSTTNAAAPVWRDPDYNITMLHAS